MKREGEALAPAARAKAIEFDPFSDDFFDDPYDTYRALRDHAPIYHSEKYDFYALSRHADMLAAHLDPGRFSSAYGQTVEGLEPLVAGTVKSFLDALGQQSEFDLVADFAALFPVEVISGMLGVAGPDRQQIRHWVDAMLHREAGSVEMTSEGMVASLELGSYLLDLVKEKRQRPDDLIISRLIEVRAIDADGVERRLSDDDVAGFSVLIAGAGRETVTKLIGNGVAGYSNLPFSTG